MIHPCFRFAFLSAVYSLALLIGSSMAIGDALAQSTTRAPERASVDSSALSLPPVLLQMIRDDLVHDELGLDSVRIASIRTILNGIDPQWFRLRDLSADQQRPEVDKLTSQLREQLARTLTPAQLNRLGQLERQALGTRMVVRSDVINSLGIGQAQQQRFLNAFLRTDKETAAIQAKLKSGAIDNSVAERNLAKLQASERKFFADQLTASQRAKLGSLTGKPFNLGLVKRLYPMPPELTDQGVTWIQGGPLKLDNLQGKVVVVHYYAFQCINCKRNLPYYQAWHDDYADKGLVIIGIQTPETSAERSLDRVKAAAAKEGIQYPIFLDGDSKNWQTWNNNAWPMVYLIDKKGFLRQWWKGELNWQGATGDQQLRSTIEMLLDEES